MKLITKTLLYYLLISLPLLFIAGYISYDLIKSEVREGTDESLWREKTNAEKLIMSFANPQNFTLSADELSRIMIVESHPRAYTFSDTLLYDKEEQEEIRHRLLRAFITYKGTTYLIQVVKPSFEEEALVESLLSSFVLVTGFLMLSFFLVNWLVSKYLWIPFHKTIDKLNNYDLHDMKRANFSSSAVKEFDQLNVALNKMTQKIYSDFIHQKEFTENAAHEMQTPLAVMKAKIDLLIQSPNLREEEMDQLQAIEGSVNKLASLNKALLLLAKIENNQFKDIAEISLKATIEKALTNYEEQIDLKKISVTKNFKSDARIKMNSTLAEVLISNLVQNSIRHNFSGGKMKIELSEDSLKISNTGEPLQVKAYELFERFKKNDASKESLGLGLSIVKSIADIYHISLAYSFIDQMHVFELGFRK